MPSVRRWLAGRAAAIAVGLLLGLGGAPAPAAADDHAVLLAVPYRTQLDGSPYERSNCGPAAIGMVLAGYGRTAPTDELRGLVNDAQGTWEVFDSGTAIEVLALIARRHGLQPLDLTAGPGLRRWTIEDVRRHLQAGRPVIPQVRYRGLPGRQEDPYAGDHYIVLIGYAGDEVVYHDPILSPISGPSRRMSVAQLMEAWGRGDLPFAGLAVAGSPTRPRVAAVPTATPTPEPTATPTPEPTATPTPTATASPTASATPTPTMTPTPSPTATPEPTATATPAVVARYPVPLAALSLALRLDPWPDALDGWLVLVVLAVMTARRSRRR